MTIQLNICCLKKKDIIPNNFLPYLNVSYLLFICLGFFLLLVLKLLRHYFVQFCKNFKGIS